MNKIQEFFSEQFGTVRTVNLDGMIYFYGIDIAKALGWDDIKADIRLKGLKPRDYIHCIGKWEDYIKYLGKCIDEMENI